MSQRGRDYVQAYSTATGATFWAHFIFGDMANEKYDNTITMSDDELVERWPISKTTLVKARRELSEAGFITILQKAAPGKSLRYRFDFPEVSLQRSPNGSAARLRTESNGASVPGTPPLALEALTTLGGASHSRRKAKVPFPVGNFFITEAMREWIEKEGLTRLDLRRETERFRDHALSMDRRCADWVRAWYNWMRKAGEYNKPSRNSQFKAVPFDGDSK